MTTDHLAGDNPLEPEATGELAPEATAEEWAPAAGTAEADEAGAAEADRAGVAQAGADAGEEAAAAAGQAGDAAAAASGRESTETAAAGQGRDQARDGAAEDPAPAVANPPAPTSGAAPTAAQLAAAVRAVESGERPAASFFTGAPRPTGPAAAKRPAAKPAGAPTEHSRPGPEVAAQRTATPPTAPPAGPASAAQSPAAPASSSAPRPVPPTAAGLDGVRQILTEGGAPAALAEKTAQVLGERAAEALRADPWQLLAVPGVRPDQADGFARALLGPACGPDDERRAQALVLWLLEQAAVAGHSALEASALRAALAQRAVPDPDAALETAITEGAVLVFQDELDTPGRPRPTADSDEEGEEERPIQILLGLDRFAMAEESVADGLARLLNTFEPPSDVEAPSGEEAPGTDTESLSPSLTAWTTAAAAAPSPSATALIQAAATSGLVTHTGAEAARAEPAALIAAARSLGLAAYGATHTENGRRRLAAHLAEAAPGAPAESLDAASVTVSGLLSGREGPGRNADGALALDLLVVLDAPQLDLETAAMLVESLADGTRLILSGDPAVLWSAGPGRLFADLLAARFCPQVTSRTPDFDPIGELVSGIGIGELNEVEAPGKEVVIVPVRNAGEAVHRTVQLVADSVPRALGISADHTQVITVGHGGAAGTRALNTALKERLNPGPGRFAGFDSGDRIAYTPAPGRTLPGTITGADAAGLHLDCDGTALTVPRDQVEAGALRHGWALTAHQAVGRRWPAAVVVLPGDAAAGLTRAWIYTAFSRGERHLSVVQGADQALPRAVTEIPAKDRTTRLRTLLRLQNTAPESPSEGN
ncbi:helix-hairpin-helix domain-containing protein [Streptomyces gilvosporeus]|uniref:ATP-dependent RecD2 DNA helicase-like helix-hairpin-helix domain-containing protein n=1 Tax=Streptomyces gilvosporeus TaxID=553510 RepID=A0A1V0TNN1_9ACTN|nr:helix-hairpin-helix domain-containing protein [Streptomyces gilvosporeus]ARF54546.1 hypothetical protein B1H19_10315 [Streptomyces gilvosporeus]